MNILEALEESILEGVNYCSYCGARWVAGNDHCLKCGKELKRFRPTADYQYRPSVIRLCRKNQTLQPVRGGKENK